MGTRAPLTRKLSPFSIAKFAGKELIEYNLKMSLACASASQTTLTSVEMWAHDAHRSWPCLRDVHGTAIKATLCAQFKLQNKTRSRSTFQNTYAEED